jgi:protein-tyrosine phosphatase
MHQHFFLQLKHFNSTYNFIKEAKNNGGKVLIHCKMGISRSASVTISFLMKENELDLETAMRKVKKARSIVSPNKSFIKQVS